MQVKMPYSGKNKSHKTHLLVKKRNEHQDLRQEGIILLVCAYAVKFMIRTALALIYKADNPLVLKEKDKCQVSVFGL